ncbi:thioredoxin domain-containing protein 3 homolog [Spodoptera frugiperda]|uniref:Thioredoxin domain-containing protein 3 homolog n=1 Tax=Spodoptera frugiperda TaxID=7108 RepID=A0A9R0DPA7_SPOFR|nr:thioredoxin domain-containing protein 3 homolog [Spodoptera frugiperda]
MARKQQVSIQETVDNNEDFANYLEVHFEQLICMEVYSEFCGPCLATGNAIRKGKLEIGEDRIAMVKACADKIDALERFKNHSEPVFLFIVRGKLTRAMFGPNGIDLCRIIEEELKFMEKESQGIVLDRPKLEIHEMLPEEAAKLEENLKIEEEYREAAERLRVLTLAARKKRVNERLSQSIKRLNFIMFWPHCHQAHYDLYEKWDMINITVAAKDTFQLTEKTAREALYMSDVDTNEACLHALLNGKVLVVLFKMFDTDTRDFVKLMRYALYEEIPVPKEDVPPEKQVPLVPAYERYATISKTAREIRRDRYNAKLQKLKEEREEMERLQAEQDRLAREAEQEAIRLEKQRKDEERMARLAAGLPAEPEPEPEPVAAPPEEGEAGEPKEGEEKVEGQETEQGTTAEGGATETASEVATTVTEMTPGDENPDEIPAEEQVVEKKEEEFNSDVEIEGEDYIPPGGLFVPGLYTPPNELAKSNGLALFYPKQVTALAETIETEYLPPHVLVIFAIDKRHDVQEVVKQYTSEILNMGIFVGEDPYNAEHIAYSIKQYDKMERPRRYYDRLALMVSRKRSLPLLQLAGLNPVYISADVISGERECLAMFPVGYGDDYVEIESVKEEEVVEVVEAAPEVTEAPEATEEKAPDEEDEEEEEGGA